MTTDAHIWPKGAVPHERVAEGMRITTAPILRSAGRWAHRLGLAPGLARDLWTATEDVDVCVMQGLWTVPVALASRIAAWRGVPYIVSARGTLEDYAMAEKALKKRLYGWLVASGTLRRAAAVHFTSDLELERSRSLIGGTKGVVVPNAFEARPLEPRRGDLLRARLGVPADSRLVAMAGRIHPRKGFGVIVPALALCSPTTHLIVIGSDHERNLPAVLDLAVASGVRERVHVLGHMEPGDLHRTYASIDLLALPSRGENFGNVIIEALAQGTPVMISDQIPLAPYVTSHGFGTVLTSLDPASWARAVDSWFDSAPPFDRENAARRVARDFDLGASGARWMEILAEVAKVHSASRS